MNFKIEVEVKGLDKLAEAMLGLVGLAKGVGSSEKKEDFSVENFGAADAIAFMPNGLPLRAVEKEVSEHTSEIVAPRKMVKEAKALADMNTPKCTMEDLKTLGVKISKAGKTAKCKSLLTEMGLKKISDTPEDRWNELHAALKGLLDE